MSHDHVVIEVAPQARRKKSHWGRGNEDLFNIHLLRLNRGAMPTNKQERAIQLYKENYGTGRSMRDIMLAAGYSQSSADNPKVLTESMDWQQAMDHFLPDTDLLKSHSELMKATKLERTEFPHWVPQVKIREILTDAGCQPRNSETNPITGITTVWYWAPDNMARKAALDLAYKLKGKLTQKVEHSGAVDGLFGSDALTINIVDAEHNPQS